MNSFNWNFNIKCISANPCVGNGLDGLGSLIGGVGKITGSLTKITGNLGKATGTLVTSLTEATGGVVGSVVGGLSGLRGGNENRNLLGKCCIADRLEKLSYSIVLLGIDRWF